jgi:hypothetical protein
MRFISTRVHGVLDYLMGIVLIASPWMFGFADNTLATRIPVLLGIGTIIYSLCTNYELGVFKGLSMRTHLVLDTLSGIFLAASPWLFGFNDYVSTPHLVLGVAEVLVALTTSRVVGRSAVSDRHITGTRVVSRDTLGTRATPGMRRDISGEPGSGNVITPQSEPKRDDLNRGTGLDNGNGSGTGTPL